MFKSELTVFTIKKTRQEDVRIFWRLLRMTLSQNSINTWTRCSCLQGHPAVKYLFEAANIALKFLKLKKSWNFWITIPFVLKIRMFSNSLTNYKMFGGCVIHFVIPRYCYYCLKRSPKNFGIRRKRPLQFSNESNATWCPQTSDRTHIKGS